MTQPYTGADIAVVREAMRNATPAARDGYRVLDAEARAALDALAAANRLLPAGVKRRLVEFAEYMAQWSADHVAGVTEHEIGSMRTAGRELQRLLAPSE